MMMMKIANFGNKSHVARENVSRVGMHSCGAKRVVGRGASSKRSVVSLGMLPVNGVFLKSCAHYFFLYMQINGQPGVLLL